MDEVNKDTNKLNQINNLCNPLCPELPPAPQYSAIIDSGCTPGHYFPHEYPVKNVTETQNVLQVTMPDYNKIRSTHTANIPIPTLPLAATKAFIFPHLHSALLSVGQLCDSECHVTFSKENVKIYK